MSIFLLQSATCSTHAIDNDKFFKNVNESVIQAEAALKHPEKTMLVIDPSMINNCYSLNDQFFGTIGVKNIGKQTRIEED